jgi:hypothetical protein
MGASMPSKTNAWALRAWLMIAVLVLGGCALPGGDGSSAPEPVATISEAVTASLSLSPDPVGSTPAGLQQQFVATYTSAKGVTTTVTKSAAWSVSNKFASVDSTGLVTAIGPGPETTNVTATYKGLTATVSLAINTATLSSIAVSPSPRTLQPGTSATFSALATFTGGPGGSGSVFTTYLPSGVIVWASRDTTVATVSSTGKVTGVAAGVTAITATCPLCVATSASGVIGEADVKVGSAKLLESITVTPAAASVGAGSTVALTATAQFGKGKNATQQDVTSDVQWKSSNGSVATIGLDPASNPGVATAVKPGTSTITATFQTNTATTSGTATLTVLEPTITPTGTTFTVTQGIPFSGTTVASFTDSDPNDAASLFSARITWGDGSSSPSSAVTVKASPTTPGTFLVEGQHTYDGAGPTYPVTVTISAPNHTSSTGFTVTSTATVAPELSANSPNLSLVQGVPLPAYPSSGGVVASFGDMNPNDKASNDGGPQDFSATIDWGDGTTTVGQVFGGPGSFQVYDAGKHFYQNATVPPAQPYPLKVTITDKSSTAVLVITGQATVAPELSANSPNLSLVQGVPFAGIVASFGDMNPKDVGATDGGPPSSFSATIDWGDGTTTVGQVRGQTGNYQVYDTGNHFYQNATVPPAQPYPLKVTVTDNSGAAVLVIQGTATVVPELSASSPYLSMVQGVPLPAYPSGAGVVVQFGDMNSNDTPSSFSVTIDWGDGTPAIPDITNGQVFDQSGSLQVYDTGNHAYQNATVPPALPYPLIVTVTDNNSHAVLVIDGQANVAPTCVGVICTTPPAPVCASSTSLLTYTSPGTCAAGTCGYVSTTQPCPFGCGSGACLPDPCLTTTCNTPPPASCSGSVPGSTLTTYPSTGTCSGSPSGATCSYMPGPVPCPFGCAAGACLPDPCLTTTCNTPPANTCSAPGPGSTATTYSQTGTCSNGPSGASCSYTATPQICSYECSGGACIPDPCAGMTCIPPNPICTNGSLQTSTGSCNAGTCTFTSSTTPCPFGCAGQAACAPDPCLTMTCNTPPSPTCSGGTTLTTYASTGTCSSGPSGGMCTYPSSTLTCPSTCTNGACGPDPLCATTTCDNPPPQTCSGTTLQTYPATGTCSAGQCSYPPNAEACPQGFQCSNNACVGPVTCTGTFSCGSYACCATLYGDGSLAGTYCAPGQAGSAVCPPNTTQLRTPPLTCPNYGAGSPVALVSNQSGPSGITTDGANLYWTDTAGGIVQSMPLGGKTPTTIASTQGGPSAIVTDFTNVYWTDTTGGAVMYYTINPPLVGTIATSQGGPVAIAVDTTNVYWTNQDGSVMAFALANLGQSGVKPTLISPTAQAGPSGIASDGTNVYWTNNTAGTVVFVPVAQIGATPSVQPTPIAQNQGGPLGIVAAGSYIVWTNQTAGQVMSYPLFSLANPPTVTVLASGQGGPTNISQDRQGNVYWINATAGTVMGAPASGDTATTEFATNQNSLQGVVGLANMGPYWTTAGGTIAFGCGVCQTTTANSNAGCTCGATLIGCNNGATSTQSVAPPGSNLVCAPLSDPAYGALCGGVNESVFQATYCCNVVEQLSGSTTTIQAVQGVAFPPCPRRDAHRHGDDRHGREPASHDQLGRRHRNAARAANGHLAGRGVGQQRGLPDQRHAHLLDRG